MPMAFIFSPRIIISSSLMRERFRLCVVAAGVAGATLGEQSLTGILGLTLALGQEGEVGGGLGLVLDCAGLLECDHVTLALEADWGYQALDLWCLLVLLAVLGGDGTADNASADVVFLGHTPELADLVCALWSEADVLGAVTESGDIGGATLDNDKVEHGKVLVDDATTNGLALALASAALAVALGALGEQKADALAGQDTLQHRESLLVVSSGDAEAVSLELSAKDIAIDFLGDALVVEVTQDAVIINLEAFLQPGFRVRDVELHYSRGFPM